MTLMTFLRALGYNYWDTDWFYSGLGHNGYKFRLMGTLLFALRAFLLFTRPEKKRVHRYRYIDVRCFHDFDSCQIINDNNNP